RINDYGTPSWSDSVSADVEAAFTNLAGTLARIAKSRRTHPVGDLLSHVADDPDPGARLGTDESLVNCWVLFLTGIRLTGYLVATSAYFLLSRPGVLDGVRRDATLVPGLVNETLRYAPSAVEPTPRVAVADVEINDRVIRRGQTVRIYFP